MCIRRIWIAAALLGCARRTTAYSYVSLTRKRTTTTFLTTAGAAARPRSVVVDPDGPTPELEQPPVERVNPDDIPGLRDVTDQSELPSPIPHQPWRRGDTAGCEAPITAQWRRDAQEEITKAVHLVGGRVLDVTWFLTTVLVTLDEEQLPEQNIFKDRGPVIDIVEPQNPLYKDPADPEPEDIWADEDDILYERENEEEAAEAADRRSNMYVNKEEGDDPDEPHIADRAGDGDDIPLYRNLETRDEVAGLVAEEEQLRNMESQQPIDLDYSINIDTAKLSTIAHAILGALEPYEDEWRILQRHELVLSSPNPAPDVLETQRQFDAFRDQHVVVETVDPFESNRTLKGQLVDRNAMDLILNIQGRMVTVPLNFVKCVRLPPGSNYAAAGYDDEDFQEHDDDDGGGGEEEEG